MTAWLMSIPASLGAVSVLVLQATASPGEGMALAQYGVLGVVAAASASGMAWLAKRFIGHLETSAKGQTEALLQTTHALHGLTESTTRAANNVAVVSESVMGLATTVSTLQKSMEILIREHERNRRE